MNEDIFVVAVIDADLVPVEHLLGYILACASDACSKHAHRVNGNFSPHYG